MNTTKTLGTAIVRTAVVALVLFVAAVAIFGRAHPAAKPAPHPGSGDSHCANVGGMLMTNFGAIDQFTTMGTATGNLRGAVSATLGQIQVDNGKVRFPVQHHWVTESGDTIFFDPAVAVTVPVNQSQTLFAVVDYSANISGGTGKFAAANGVLHFIGEADLAVGTVFRYTGQVCFAHAD